MTGISTQSLEKQIDELQVNINRLEIECQSKESQLERAKQEIAEWENWNQGISGKNKKTSRKVVQTWFYSWWTLTYLKVAIAPTHEENVSVSSYCPLTTP